MALPGGSRLHAFSRDYSCQYYFRSNSFENLNFHTSDGDFFTHITLPMCFLICMLTFLGNSLYPDMPVRAQVGKNIHLHGKLSEFYMFCRRSKKSKHLSSALCEKQCFHIMFPYNGSRTFETIKLLKKSTSCV